MALVFFRFELHGDKGRVLVNPFEFSSISPAPEGGTRIVTKQKQVYYVEEKLFEVDDMIEDFRETLRNKKEGY